MKQRLLESVGRSARLKVLNELKRTSGGLPVAQLAGRLQMSYMGVKDLCIDLEKRGLLDTWRQPVKQGRPLMLYRLTDKAHDLYPTASNPLTIELLEAAQKLYGPSAPEKLLLVAFQNKIEGYQRRLVDGSLAQRAESLARIRDEDGHMAEWRPRNEQGELWIIEHHSPILDVLRAFPLVARLETELYQRLLGVAVRREEAAAAGLFCVSYALKDELE